MEASTLKSRGILLLKVYQKFERNGLKSLFVSDIDMSWIKSLKKKKYFLICTLAKNSNVKFKIAFSLTFINAKMYS